jgi:hypothetical protein
MQGQTLEAAAAAAGMSERSARTWQDGPMPSAVATARTWRTRADPFAEVWAAEIEPFLRSDEDGELLATTLMDELCRRHPGKFEPGQVRTLQRQIRRWRAIVVDPDVRRSNAQVRRWRRTLVVMGSSGR